MSAHLAENDFVFKLATSQTYIDHAYDDHGYDPATLPGEQQASTGLLRWLGDGVAFVAQGFKNWMSREATLSDMGMMSDRELADIGLNRSDLPRVFDEDFVADHARGRLNY